MDDNQNEWGEVESSSIKRFRVGGCLSVGLLRREEGGRRGGAGHVKPD